MSTVEHDPFIVADDNPRPLKRQRLSSSSSSPSTAFPVLTHPLPAAPLLLALPALIIHPPTHKNHARSIHLARLALRKCLALPNLDPDAECRAWAGLAELGMIAGLGEDGVQGEVERGIMKANLIAQKHPFLRTYKPHLTLLSARLAQWQHNPRLAQSTLRRLFSSFLLLADPPHVVYAVHLGLIASLTESTAGGNDTGGMHMGKVLDAITHLHTFATENGHPSMAHLALLIRLRVLMTCGRWDEVREGVHAVEGVLGVVFDDAPAASATGKAKDGNGAAKCLTLAQTKPKPEPIPARTPVETVLTLHLLIISVLLHTYAGDAASAMRRLTRVHELLDGGALDAFGTTGIIEIPFPSSPPLHLQATPPRLLYTLVFLLSSVAKRDPVGRRPKRKVFAVEGLGVLGREGAKEVALPKWASHQELQDVNGRMGKIKADLLSELVGVCIMRSEFDEAERNLSLLTAHTRTHRLFSTYAARITLHHAQLAHALEETERAMRCYRVAGYLSRARVKVKEEAAGDIGEDEEGADDPWLNAAARAGEVWVRIGVLRRDAALASAAGDQKGNGDERDRQGNVNEKDRQKANERHKRRDTQKDREKEKAREHELEELRRIGKDVIKTCQGMGGTLEAIGEVLEACLAKEFLKAKTHLRRALSTATSAQDNHLRALVLALIAAHYLHTSAEHAQAMLTTADQLAAGLGAQARVKKDGSGGKGKEGSKPQADAVGNAQLRLWIGEQVLELHRWGGDEKRAETQVGVNDTLREAVRKVGVRGAALVA